MKKKLRLWMIRLMIAFAAVFVLANIIAYRQAYAMMHFKVKGELTEKPEKLSFMAKTKILFTGISVPRPQCDRVPTDLAPDCREITIASSDDIKLSAWYCDRGHESPLAIIFHGYTSQKSDLLYETGKFLDMGTSVLLVDFRGSGGSSESYTTVGMREGDDVAAAVHYAEEHLQYSSMVVYGRSMGAAAILRAIHEESIAPDAVIIEAVFDTMLSTVCNRFDIFGIPSFPAAGMLVFWGGVQFGFNGFDNNPAEYAKALKCPALFMHGENDPRAKLSEGRRVYDAVPGNKKFVIFKGTGHQSYAKAYPEQWAKEISGFLRDYQN